MQYFGLKENTFEGFLSLENIGRCELGVLNYLLQHFSFENRQGIVRSYGMVLILNLGLKKIFLEGGLPWTRRGVVLVILIPALFQKS